MKAYVLHKIGDFSCEEIERPVPKAGEVLVHVKAAGICGSDIPRVFETGAHVHPLVLGHEFSGQVVELGPEASASWQGKRVGIFPLIPCGECEPCQQKRFELCENYSYLGSRCNGGFAEYVCVPEKNLIELPENVTYQEAAMMEPMAVSVHAMRRTNVSSDESVVVFGLGTIGLLLTMFLLERGIKNIYVVGNKEFQKEKAMSLGVTEEDYCNSKEISVRDWIFEKTSGKGVDVFFECVGKNEVVETAIACTKAMGRVMLVGNPYSDMILDKQVYWRILRKQLTVLGTWNSSFLHEKDDDWNYVLQRLAEKTVNPTSFITHRYTWDNFYEGFLVMRDKRENYCKVICEDTEE